MVNHKALPEDIAAPGVRVDSVGSAVVDLSPTMELESLFEGAFEAAPCGLALVDQDGLIVRVNRELSNIVGHEPAAMEDEHLRQFVAERYHEDPLQFWGSSFEERSHQPLGTRPDIAMLHADGREIPVEIGVATVAAKRSTLALVAFNNISERVRLERHLRDANSELEEFSNVASHDLKSPLRGVRDLVEWITEDLGTTAPASVTTNLERIRTRVERMETLIDDLLSYARVGRTAGGYRQVDMSELVRRALWLAAIPETFTVTIDIALEPFFASSTPLETVLRNLVSNAVKHNDRPDGSIVIRARTVGAFCRIEVIDDGPGVPAFAQEKIFRLFQTAYAHHVDHAGVGLALCQRLCDSHGASISVESGTGRGATFVVEWPLVSRRDAIDE